MWFRDRLFQLLLTVLLLAPVVAHAQSTGRVVASCGTIPQQYNVGTTSLMTMLPTGEACISGGGGGGGGAVTIADGADVTQGAVADAAWVSGNGTTISLLKNIATGVGSSVPAGTNVIGHVIIDTGSTTVVSALPATPAGSSIIGKVGIDQTTPGTTNGVQINAALPAGANVIGHTIIDTGSTTAVSSLPATPAGSSIIGKVGIDQTTPGTTNGVQVNAALPAGTNLLGDANLRQGGTALSATNGIFTNLLLGNAVLSATNGLFANTLQGNAVLSATNGIYANLLVGNAAVATNTGATGSTSPRFTVATDQATNAGAALKTGGVGVVNGGSNYETIAASQTGQAMGATGATGDYLSHCTVFPVTTSPGVVTVFDSTSSAANNVITFAGGASSTSNLVPFSIPVGAVSLNGAWKVTTGANVIVTCYGKFT